MLPSLVLPALLAVDFIGGRTAFMAMAGAGVIRRNQADCGERQQGNKQRAGNVLDQSHAAFNSTRRAA